MSTEQEQYGKMAEPEILKFEMSEYVNPEDLIIKAVDVTANIRFPFLLDFTKCKSLEELCILLNKCKITITAIHEEYDYLKKNYSNEKS